MSLNEITNKVNELASNWEQFKALNDRKLKEIEKRGAADPVTLDQLQKLNDNMDQYQSSLGRIEAVLSRPGGETKMNINNPEDREYRNAFCSYLRKGNEVNLAQLEKKSLSVSSDVDGGYLVTHHMAENMIKILHDASPMRQVANVTSISTDALELIEDTEDATVGWTAETAARTETKTPIIGKKIIPVHELYAQPKATQKLVDDSRIDIESWLSEKLTDVFLRKENDAFINGDGVGKPKGILKYPNSSNWGEIEQTTTEADTIKAEHIYNLYFQLKEIYAVNAKFMMNRSIVQIIRMLKDGANNYLWQPGLAAGTPDTLLGCEVVQSADMPKLSKGNLVIAFADFKTAYK